MYERFDRLIRFLVKTRRLPPAVEEDDIVQSVWLRLLESGFNEDDPGATAYIRETVKTVIADSAGPPVRNSSNYSEGDHHLWFLDRLVEAPEEIDLERLEAALRTLTEPDRLLLQRRYLEGVPIRTIAKNERTTKWSIYHRLRLARRRARRAYDKAGETS